MMVSEQDDVRLLKPVKEIWSEALVLLEKRISHAAFHSFFRVSQLIEIKDGEASIAVLNDLGRTMLSNQSTAIAEVLQQITGEKLRIKVVFDKAANNGSYAPSIGSVVIAPEVGGDEPDDAPARTSDIRAYTQEVFRRPTLTNLNPRNTFETFVVGSNNRFCHSAAQAVAKSPGQAYNPLFIYGGVGLGKTHILHAIGNEILKTSPNLTIRYISCEKFTNELINSIAEGPNKMLDFRRRYRQVDVLLVDDIQFIEKKDATQEEFFHTFNTLRDNQRQIILSSDRPPKALAALEERLRSRFEWGLITDMQPPDFETRLAILQKKCAIENMQVEHDVLEHVAATVTTNIRELEGALIRLNAYAKLTGSPLSIREVSDVLQPGKGSGANKPVLTIDQLIDIVGAHYRVESSEIRSSKRSQDLALPRHVAMFLAHEVMQMSFPRIGQSFGNRKHTSAMYAHTRVKEQMETDAQLVAAIKHIRRQLGC